MKQGNIVSIEDRIPKLKQQRRKKANKRLTILLILFFTMIALVVYFQSPLSHVKRVVVKGNVSYSEEELIGISGITKETNIWRVDETTIKERLESLPEIKNAAITLKFPNSIELNMMEYRQIAFLVQEKNYYPVLENGTLLKEKRALEGFTANAPLLFSFEEGEILDEMILSLQALPENVLNSISEIHYEPVKTDTYRIALFMNDGFEVNASLRTFAEKMAHYPSIVSQLDPKIKGVIDLEVGSYFKAYKVEGAEENEDENEQQ